MKLFLIAMLSILGLGVNTARAQEIIDVTYLCSDYEEVPGVVETISRTWYTTTPMGEIISQQLPSNVCALGRNRTLRCPAGYTGHQVGASAINPVANVRNQPACYVKVCCDETEFPDLSIPYVPGTANSDNYTDRMGAGGIIK